MITTTDTALQKPSIVRFSQSYVDGVVANSISCHCIGYVVQGTKYVYQGDSRKELGAGTLFYEGIGTHYIECLPDPKGDFLQVLFYFTHTQLNRIITTLTMQYDLDVSQLRCERTRLSDGDIFVQAGSNIRHFFSGLNIYFKGDILVKDDNVAQIKLAELVYLIVSGSPNALRDKLLCSLDPASDLFAITIHNHVFDNISMEQLAGLCNRSLTAFKKEFRRRFNQPPHQWIVCQRLMRASLLLVSTDKSVSEIGSECKFNNTSHFIKLFKNEFATTPAVYRSRMRGKSGCDHLAKPTGNSVRAV